MKYTRKIIESNLSQYPDAEYYFKLLDIIEENLYSHPDVVIDTCKALIEWVCRFILLTNNPAHTKVSVEWFDFIPLYNESMKRLETISDVELDFINWYKALIEKVRKLRNDRWDVSHWKIAPKEFYSSSDFAIMLSSFTDGVVYYIFAVFFWVDFWKTEQQEYEDNDDFNNYLDEWKEEIFTQPYSYAMFTLDYNEYIRLFDIYNANKIDDE